MHIKIIVVVLECPIYKELIDEGFLFLLSIVPKKLTFIWKRLTEKFAQIISQQNPKLIQYKYRILWYKSQKPKNAIWPYLNDFYAMNLWCFLNSLDLQNFFYFTNNEVQL